ncbi:MAG: helix-turn-helix domain-containing protein [Planctomycetes bacterium]|nr:helix-turn-helix domain-containing protein [Planctomycetota bacterium]MCC7169131.1 helix-turn-helix domain-containing protein [Planctomycetota bacterium]
MDPIETQADEAVLGQLGQRLAQLRLAANQTQAQLAGVAGVSQRTVARIEDGESTQLTNWIRVLRALGLLANLDRLVPAPGPSPLAQLEAKSKVRRRASTKRAPRGTPRPWSWDDEVKPDRSDS